MVGDVHSAAQRGKGVGKGVGKGTGNGVGRAQAKGVGSGANGECETGALAELGGKADENQAAVGAKNARLGAVKFGPAAQVGQMVVAEHGKCAAERLGGLHVRRFTEEMMSTLHDMMSRPRDNMSKALAADLLPRRFVGGPIIGLGNVQKAQSQVEVKVSARAV